MPTKEDPATQSSKDEPAKAEIAIDAWELEDPDQDYVADLAAISRSDDVVTAYFIQQLPDGRAINAVGLVMSAERATGFLDEGSRAIRDVLAARFGQEAGSLSADLSSLQPDQIRKYPTAYVRMAVNDDWGMLDFYSMEVMTAERARKLTRTAQVVEKFVPSVRVFLSPKLMHRLLNGIRLVLQR